MVTQDEVIKACQRCIDPELELDIWTLGLVYKIEIVDDTVKILMTFTSPLCPYGPELVGLVDKELKEIGVQEVKVTVTFDPPWKPSEELREMLGV